MVIDGQLNDRKKNAHDKNEQERTYNFSFMKISRMDVLDNVQHASKITDKIESNNRFFAGFVFIWTDYGGFESLLFVAH